MNQSIFKAYDVRGIYPVDLNEEVIYAIGRAAVIYFNAKKIVIGRDIRESSPSLFEALAKGITDQGADVLDLGLATTPMVYFATARLDVDASISLTASHNTAEWNGLKFTGKGVVPVGKDTGLFTIRDIAMEGDFKNPEKTGTVIPVDIKKEYFDYIGSFAKFGDKKFKVAIDLANAMGILDLELLRRFPDNIEFVTLYDTLDGKFPNHEANPIKPETLEELQKEVVAQKADLGLALDGDADRVAFLDENGNIISMDLIAILLAKEALENHPGGTVAFDLRATKSAKEIVEELGGKAIDTKVGHSNVKQLMRETGAVFGGELSGHYFFNERYIAEHGMLPAIMIMNLLAETGKKLSQLTAEVKRYVHSGEINSEVDDVQKVINDLKAKYSDGSFMELDGITVSYPNWWFNVRPSNTEPVIRLTLEADTQELMEQKRDELLNLIRS